MNRGKLAVLLIFAIAIAMGTVAIVYQSQQDRKLLNAWTGEHIARIRAGTQVELLMLENNGEEDTGERSDLSIRGAGVKVTSREDVTDALGLVHARHVLIQDSSYDWQQSADTAGVVWQFGFVFTDASGTSTVLLDDQARVAYLLEADSALVAGEMGQRLKKYAGDALNAPLDGSPPE